MRGNFLILKRERISQIYYTNQINSVKKRNAHLKNTAVALTY